MSHNSVNNDHSSDGATRRDDGRSTSTGVPWKSTWKAKTDRSKQTAEGWKTMDLSSLNGVGGCLVYDDGRVYIGEYRYGAYTDEDGNITKDLRFVPEQYTSSHAGRSSVLLIRNRSVSQIAAQNITRAIAVRSRHGRLNTVMLWDTFQYNMVRQRKDKALLTRRKDNASSIKWCMDELVDDYRENKRLKKARAQAERMGALDSPCVDPSVPVQEMARLDDPSPEHGVDGFHFTRSSEESLWNSDDYRLQW